MTKVRAAALLAVPPLVAAVVRAEARVLRARELRAVAAAVAPTIPEVVRTPVVVPELAALAVRMSREVMTIRPLMVNNRKGTDAVSALVPFFCALWAIKFGEDALYL